MSQYTIAGNRPELSIVVGWDNPLRSYFAQVWDGGELGLWAGAGGDRIPTLEALAELVAPYGDIPAEVLEQLEEDHEAATLRRSTEMRIIACNITSLPKSLHDPLPRVEVTLENGEMKTLFDYYPDEIAFEPSEFVGLTVDEAMRLKSGKDLAFLRD